VEEWECIHMHQYTQMCNDCAKGCNNTDSKAIPISITYANLQGQKISCNSFLCCFVTCRKLLRNGSSLMAKCRSRSSCRLLFLCQITCGAAICMLSKTHWLLFMPNATTSSCRFRKAVQGIINIVQNYQFV
jgi:hypothetical protein